MVAGGDSPKADAGSPHYPPVGHRKCIVGWGLAPTVRYKVTSSPGADAQWQRFPPVGACPHRAVQGYEFAGGRCAMAAFPAGGGKPPPYDRLMNVHRDILCRMFLDKFSQILYDIQWKDRKKL